MVRGRLLVESDPDAASELLDAPPPPEYEELGAPALAARARERGPVLMASWKQQALIRGARRRGLGRPLRPGQRAPTGTRTCSR